jgi:site-specific DNA-methyltransferase (adenine-specific)
MSLYYEDEYVTLYHGDCRNLINWQRAEVLITDPPYGIGWKQGNNAKARRSAHQGILNDEDTSARDTAVKLWGEKPYLVFGTPNAPEPPGVKQVLIWRKPVDAGVVTCTTGFRRDTEFIYLGGKWPRKGAARSSVLTTDGSIHNYLNGHPHAKPVPLMMQLIEAAPEGVIADPFSGSGSTLVAARNLGRKAIGVEMSEEYCELIVKRLSQQAFDFSVLEAS